MRAGIVQSMRPAVLAISVGALCAACVHGETPTVRDRANALEVTRRDGTRVRFGGPIRAWCGPVGELTGDDIGDDRALHVLGGELPPPQAEEPVDAFWVISRPLRHLEKSETLELPTEHERDTTFFLLYPRGRLEENELSAYEEGSKGELVFEEWGCDKGDRVRIRANATVASEFHGASPVEVDGEISVVIGDRPPIRE